LCRFFAPSDTLYDAMMWKRWALSGDLVKLPQALANHPVVLVGPPQFRSLGAKWNISDFRHVEIPIDFSHLIRGKMLASLDGVLREAHKNRNGKSPVVLFQCSGELSYWLMRRLRPRYAGVFYIDLGQALDLWHWKPEESWALVYGDAIR